MKKRTQSEWLEWYKTKTGCEDLELADDETIFFHPEHGFMICFTHDNILEVHHMAGDGKYWTGFIRDVIAKHCEIDKVRMYTQRNPEAWKRKYGGRIIGYEMEADIDEIKV